MFLLSHLPVSFLHRLHIFSIRSGVLLRKSSVILRFSGFCTVGLALMLDSKVGKACLSKVTVLLLLLYREREKITLSGGKNRSSTSCIF